MGRTPNQALTSLAVVLAALLLSSPAAAQRPVDVSVRLDPDSPAGTDEGGRVLMFAPSPLQPGSSVSHFDSSARPDLLMEPSNSPLLGFAQLDLTVPLFEDVGWPRGSAHIQLNFSDPSGEGFHHPSLGAQRRAAMELAAGVWADVLRSDVTIHVEARFLELECGGGSGVLAQAGPRFVFRDFPGAPEANTWYVGALAEALSGLNLSLEDDPNPGAAELRVTFNRNIDNGCIAAGRTFYYGLDGNLPPQRISFVNVALHELAHGLGFISLTNSGTGLFFQGVPDIYGRHLFDGERGRTWPQMSAEERRLSAAGGRLAWFGPRVTNAAPGFLEPGPVLRVTAPAAIAGNYRVSTADFGPPPTLAGVAARLAQGFDGSADPTLGCEALVNPGEVNGRIALLDRGDCLFVTKALHAQQAGATALVIVNNVPGPPVRMGGDDPSIAIPVVQVSREDGDLLVQALTTGFPPAAPTGLTALAVPGGILLGWTITSDDETAFQIQRSPQGGSFQQIATVGAGVDTLFDPVTAPGQTFTYRVRAVNEVGASPFSNQASATTPELLAPEAPTGLSAIAGPGAALQLSWSPPVGAEAQELEARVVARRLPGGLTEWLDEPFAPLATLAGDAASFEAAGLAAATTYELRLRASNAAGTSAFSAPASATTPAAGEPEPCTAGVESLCLLGERFEVRAFFKNQHGGGALGTGRAFPVAGDSGTFWFFEPSNLELMVKVLDGRPVNGFFWVFFGGLSDVEYWIAVTDTETGEVTTYHNPPGEICGQADVVAFPLGAAGSAAVLAGADEAPEAAARAAATAVQGSSGVPCVAAPETLCLHGDRFAVSVDWVNQRHGSTGTGRAIPSASGDSTGFFWFFDPSNLELVVKVLDGRPVNGKIWVFYGALSDVEYTLEVTDTETDAVAIYHNPPGNICGVGDTEAFEP